MAQDHVFNLLPAYALGSLDEEDLLLVARHLPGCPVCRKELEGMIATADQLAFSIPLVDPPSDLRGRVLRRVESTSAQPVPASQPVPTHPSLMDGLRSLFKHPVGLAFGLAALLLLAFLVVNNVLLWRQVNTLQAQQSAAGNMRVVQLAGTTNAPQAVGYMMVFKEENYGTLAIENAPQLEPGKQYQVWLMKDGKRTSGGVFDVNENGYGVLEIISNTPLENYQSFGITIEPAGGSPQPTGKKVLGGNL